MIAAACTAIAVVALGAALRPRPSTRRPRPPLAIEAAPRTRALRFRRRPSAQVTAASLGLDGTETFDIDVDDTLRPRQDVPVRATRTDGSTVEFTATCRVDTPVEVDYYRNGGILHTVLRTMAAS